MIRNYRSILILIALSVSIATGRWGSWIGIPSKNLFLIDLILIFSLLYPSKIRAYPKDILFAFFLCIYIIFEFLESLKYATSLQLRDLAPFLYLLIFIAFRRSIVAISQEQLFKWLRIATLFSLIWNLGRSLGVMKEFEISDFTGVPIFSERADQFGFVAAIGIIVWSEKRYSSVYKPAGRSLITFLFILEVTLLPGRAGALAASLGIVFLIVARDTHSQRTRIFGRRVIYIVITLLVLGSAVANLLPEHSSLKRSGLIPGTEVSRTSGQGTADARRIAQGLVLSWTIENRQMVFGAGPGREIVLESGAYKWLSGSTDVRQPHNWWVSLFSRFGACGLILWISIVFHYLGPIKKQMFRDPRTFILLAILVTATFGVILESPFGLVPFYFFLMRKQMQSN